MYRKVCNKNSSAEYDGCLFYQRVKRWEQGDWGKPPAPSGGSGEGRTDFRSLQTDWIKCYQQPSERKINSYLMWDSTPGDWLLPKSFWNYISSILTLKFKHFKKFSLNVIFLCYLSYLGSSTLSTCELFLSFLLSQEILNIFFLFKCSNKHICHRSFNSSELGFCPF